MPSLRTTIVWSIVSIATAVAVAPSAGATLTAPPISIAACHVENFGGYGGAVADVLIKYTNTYASPATSVKFSVNYHGQHAYIVDKGSFAPNVTLTHRFHTFTDQPYNGKTLNACVAIHAAFADGSTWSF